MAGENMEGIDACNCISKPLVERVQNRLELKKQGVEKLIDNTLSAGARNNNPHYASEFVDYISKDRWRINAIELIKGFCKVIDDNSDNGESSKNDVDDAISSLLYLAPQLSEFNELGDLAKHLETHFRKRSKSVSIKSEETKKKIEDLLTKKKNCAEDKEKREILQEIEKRRNSRMVSVNIFNRHRKTFQTLLFISEVTSYVLDWTAKNNIRILVAILVLSATCCLAINIPLILRWWRNRSVRVFSQIEWVESSFSIFLLGADILKVAGHDKAGTKVMETWFVVFAAIGYVRLFLMDRNANVDGRRSSRVIRN